MLSSNGLQVGIGGDAGGGDDSAQMEEVFPLVDGVGSPVGLLDEANLLEREMALDDGGFARALR